MLDDTTPLHTFRKRFAALHTEPCSERVWSDFVAFVDEMTTEAATIVKLPVRSEGRASGNRTAIDPNDAKGIQSLYRRNRRTAVRLILSGEGQSCVAVQDVEDHFRDVWTPSNCNMDIFPRIGRPCSSANRFVPVRRCFQTTWEIRKHGDWGRRAHVSPLEETRSWVHGPDDGGN